MNEILVTNSHVAETRSGFKSGRVYSILCWPWEQYTYAVQVRLPSGGNETLRWGFDNIYDALQFIDHVETDYIEKVAV